MDEFLLVDIRKPLFSLILIRVSKALLPNCLMLTPTDNCFVGIILSNPLLYNSFKSFSTPSSI